MPKAGDSTRLAKVGIHQQMSEGNDETIGYKIDNQAYYLYRVQFKPFVVRLSAIGAKVKET